MVFKTFNISGIQFIPNELLHFYEGINCD